MRILSLFGAAVLLAFFAVSCEKNPVEEYGMGRTNTYLNLKESSKSIDIESVRNAIRAYKAANEKYPANIAEISALMGSELDPEKYNYDPVTGNISLR